MQDKHGVPTVKIAPATMLKNDGPAAGSGARYTSIPNNQLVGTSGTGPCIGVIIVTPPDKAGNRTVYVYHFDAGDHPKTTLGRDGAFPKGSTAVLFGGDNNNPISMGTLHSAMQYLTEGQRTPVTIVGIYNSAGMWVDNNGDYYTSEGARRVAYNDGTQPPPLPQ